MIIGSSAMAMPPPAAPSLPAVATGRMGRIATRVVVDDAVYVPLASGPHLAHRIELLCPAARCSAPSSASTWRPMSSLSPCTTRLIARGLKKLITSTCFSTTAPVLFLHAKALQIRGPWNCWRTKQSPSTSAGTMKNCVAPNVYSNDRGATVGDFLTGSVVSEFGRLHASVTRHYVQAVVRGLEELHRVSLPTEDREWG
jgi:hypothetical protein